MFQVGFLPFVIKGLLLSKLSLIFLLSLVVQLSVKFGVQSTTGERNKNSI